MCGIAGLLGGNVTSDRLRAMAAAIEHRGPDDGGVWSDADAGIGLGHRRLSIVDLSASGHQPMASADQRWMLAYNGEIYNHMALRQTLEGSGHVPEGGWRGHSDTETLLAAIGAWGLAGALTRSVGMFAIALWDRRERTLSLARDRFGEKPLYWGWAAGGIAFASELKAIRALPGFANPVSRRATALFAARTYVPAPLSIYEGLFKLNPGCILTLTAEAARSPLTDAPAIGEGRAGITLERYWDYREVVRRGLAEPVTDEGEALAGLDAVLGQAIAGQAVADVPVGAFLSGGIDSSTIVGLYQRHSATPVRTFSIGFAEAGFNEAEYAKAVAAHFGTVHNERYVTVAETRDVIPQLPAMYDEPFADSSQIPTHLVSKFAREQVTVALSGDGGDELFAGYNRHFMAPGLWDKIRRLPRPVRAAVGAPLSKVPPGLWSLAAGKAQRHFGAKIQKGLRVAGAARRFDDVYESFLDEWAFEPSPVRGAAANDRFDMELGPEASDTVRMTYCDAVSYLPDDILCKVDRAAMAVSLETRVPFLDHRVAEYAARIPVSMKVRGGRGKHILRELLYTQAPRTMFERPKAGFAIPVGEWIKGPLRDWAETLLDPRQMRDAGYFEPKLIQARWQAHLTGRRDSTQALWAVLMFQAWLAEQR